MTNINHSHAATNAFSMDIYHTGEMCRCGSMRIWTHSLHSTGAGSWYGVEHTKRRVNDLFKDGNAWQEIKDKAAEVWARRRRK